MLGCCPIVAQIMQLEVVTPALRTLPVLDLAGENLVKIPFDVVAHGYHRTVDACYPRASAEDVKFHKQRHGDEHPRHQFDETVAGDSVGDLTSQIPLETV